MLFSLYQLLVLYPQSHPSGVPYMTNYMFHFKIFLTTRPIIDLEMSLDRLFHDLKLYNPLGVTPRTLEPNFQKKTSNQEGKSLIFDMFYNVFNNKH